MKFLNLKKIINAWNMSGKRNIEFKKFSTKKLGQCLPPKRGLLVEAVSSIGMPISFLSGLEILQKSEQLAPSAKGAVAKSVE